MGRSAWSVQFFFSRQFLLSRFVLWALFWTNALGTVYGYMWYWNQLEVVASEKPLWMLVFVPDSPTASLFFTISLLYLLFRERWNKTPRLRALIDALAAITSVKYGIWAVVMIVLGGMHGDPITWQDWMLSISHIGMAVEVVLFFRFFGAGFIALCIAGLWTLINDFVDYTFDIYPWLPRSLDDFIHQISIFTVGLTMLSILFFIVLLLQTRSKRDNPSI